MLAETSNLAILALEQPVIARETCREYAHTRKQNLSFALPSKRQVPLLTQTHYAQQHRLFSVVAWRYPQHNKISKVTSWTTLDSKVNTA